MTFKADLHCHTTASDGSFSPVKILEHAQSLGLQGLCITDHDTIAAYETAIPAAKTLGLVLGTGVEFSADYLGTSVHVLGYDFSLESQALHDFCLGHTTRRQERNRIILEKLKKIRMPIEESELEIFKLGSVGRPHIAQLMVEKKYVQSIRQAFQLYIGEGKCCYHPGKAISVQQTIDLIHEAKGKAFIAHPHLLNGHRLIRELLKLNFDGLEAYYSKCPLDHEKRWLKIAQEKNWLISGGSDFHGDIRPHIPLGCSWVDHPTFTQIFTNTSS